jgi:hypothetical protein
MFEGLNMGDTQESDTAKDREVVALGLDAAAADEDKWSEERWGEDDATRGPKKRKDSKELVLEEVPDLILDEEDEKSDKMQD